MDGPQWIIVLMTSNDLQGHGYSFDMLVFLVLIVYDVLGQCVLSKNSSILYNLDGYMCFF